MIYLLVSLFIYHKGNDLSDNFFVSLICLFSQKGQLSSTAVFKCARGTFYYHSTFYGLHVC